MATETEQIALDTEVFASDGEPLGRVSHIWHPDGRVDRAFAVTDRRHGTM